MRYHWNTTHVRTDNAVLDAPGGYPLQSPPLAHAHLPLLGPRLHRLDLLLQLSHVVSFMLLIVVQLA